MRFANNFTSLHESAASAVYLEESGMWDQGTQCAQISTNQDECNMYVLS